MTVGSSKRERPRAFADDWKTPGSPRPPTTIANPLGAIGAMPGALSAGDVAAARGVDHAGGIDLSPDGHEVAFAWERDGSTEIYTAPLEGDRIIQLTDADARSSAPRWSPDGHWVAFVREVAGKRALFIVDRDGEHEREAGSEGVKLSADGAPQWSTDAAGSMLDKAGIDHVPGSATSSPDGSMIGYTTHAEGRTRIAFADVRDGAVARSKVLWVGQPFDDEAPVWRPDGRGVVYLRRDGSNVAARRVFTVSHADEAVIDLPGWVFSPRIAPDSETVVAVLVDREGSEVVVRPKGAISIQRLTRTARA